MEAPSSAGSPSTEAHKLREQESHALPLLRAAFSCSAESLEEALSPPPASRHLPIRLPACAGPHFHDLLASLARSIPRPGVLPTEASILDAQLLKYDVSEATRRHQDVYRKRDNIYSEQQRKIHAAVWLPQTIITFVERLYYISSRKFLLPLV